MKKYICKDVPSDYGGYLDIEKELIRCKDCKHRPHKNKDGYTMPPRVQVGVYAWGEPKYDDDETCPYVCEDRWYSRIPNDEQYCDRAEPKETEQ
jgi:hypothetical protein